MIGRTCGARDPAEGFGGGAGIAARLIWGAGILAEAGPNNAALTMSGVNSRLDCATVTSLRAL